MAPSLNKLMCAGCDVILRKTKGKKKLMNTTDEAKAFSSCLKQVKVVGAILCVNVDSLFIEKIILTTTLIVKLKQIFLLLNQRLITQHLK